MFLKQYFLDWYGTWAVNIRQMVTFLAKKKVYAQMRIYKGTFV